MFFNTLPLGSFLLLTGILMLRILVLKRKGIEVSSKGGKKSKIKIFLFPVFSLVFLVWLFEITKPAFQVTVSLLPEMITERIVDSIFLKITGTGLILVSLILLLTTLIHFKTSLRFGLNENNQGKLVTTGIFSISRNPFFLSLILYFSGIAFIFVSLFFIGFAVFSIIGIHFFILKEEKFMREVYGEEYKRYAEKVHRYF